MPNTPNLEKYISISAFLIIGVYLVIYGAKSKTLINESEVMATEEEKRNANATPARRVAVVVAGLVAVLYGIVRLMK